MRIAKITLNNFKTFHDECEINTDSAMVCLVGENNTGKSTIFGAIDFLKNGVAKDRSIDDYKNKKRLDDDVTVEITLKGNIKPVIENFSDSKFLTYIFDENGIETIRLRRSSEKKEITQNKKQVQLDERKLTIFNSETDQFENPAGFDKAIGSLFETQFVWSEMQAGDVVDFGSTKMLGRLLKEISDEFQKSDEWSDFANAHQKAFVTSENALSKQANQIVGEIKSSLGDFYGEADIQLDFQIPDPLSFVKLGDVLVDDGVTTSIKEKGSGMQRALALAVIKVYAGFLARHDDNHTLTKPFFFLIDEPEISLHPKAQSILARALREIANRQQVFVATHSPHFLKDFDPQGDGILVVSRGIKDISIKPANYIKNFPFSPTLAEINYYAYGLRTIDFHNELYGHIQETTQQHKSDDLDDWFQQHFALQKNRKWIKVEKGVVKPARDVSLMTYVRHSIHHGENTQNPKFSHKDLADSIEAMLKVTQSPIFISILTQTP